MPSPNGKRRPDLLLPAPTIRVRIRGDLRFRARAVGETVGIIFGDPSLYMAALERMGDHEPAADEAPPYRPGIALTYSHCDDWLIYARDAHGRLYFLCTELWPEWLDCPPGADQELGAVERYMLPIARARWDELLFRLAEAPRSESDG